MKIKRFMAPLLALALSFALAAPAFAAPVPPEVETVQSTDVDAPRYAVNRAVYKLNMDNNTYAELVFWMAEKSGKFYFESLESISFYNTNPNGSHWDILSNSHTLRSDRFELCVMLMDMEGDTPSSSIRYDVCYGILPNQVMSYSRSAQDGNGVKLAPESVRVSWSENVVPVQDENGVKLAPESVRVIW